MRQNKLVDLNALATTDDKPILPGESVILHPGRGEGDLRKWLGSNGYDVEHALSKLAITFQTISFGNGTGYQAGSPYLARRR